MTRKLRALMSVAMAIGFLLSCTEDFSYQSSYKEQNEKELLLIAKAMVQNHGNTVILPINQVRNTESRSALSFIAEATPLWDNVKYDDINGMQVLMVDLQTTEEILSRVSVTKNGKTEIQESTTFSRLVIRKKGTEVYTHVLTYMPENNYAAANKERLDTLGYYPHYVDFTGVTLTSHLDGTIFRGIRYKDGKMVGLITKEKPNVCSHEHHEGETCSHEHSSDNYNIVSINLFAQSGLQPMSRASRTCDNCGAEYDDNNKCMCLLPNEGKMCLRCHTVSVDSNGRCLRCGFYENEICDKCGKPLYRCICGDDNKNTCPICGVALSEDDYANGHTCFPEVCPTCGKENCTCSDPEPDIEPDPDPDTAPIDTCNICLTYPCICCDTCLTYPCICLVNTTPVDYIAHDRDWILGEAECISVTTCCPMAVLEMAYKVLGGTEMTQEIFAQYYTQINIESPSEETVLEYNDGFMNQFFSTSSTSDISDDIELGNVVVIRQNGHYLLAFGLQYDGDVIYADLHESKLYVVNENYFSASDYFTIDGLSSVEKSRKIE